MVVLLGAALLSACSEEAEQSPAPSEAQPLAADIEQSSDPALWEITKDGEVEGWLFGTIHALPDGTEWRTPEIESAIKESDVLVVEIANLEDKKATSEIFYELALTPNEPPLSARLPFGMQGQLRELLVATKTNEADFDSTETWAAALTLAQAAQTRSKADNGVDLALTKEFSNRRVVELEGVRAQLQIFDQLPEKEQRDMLAAVVREGSKPLIDREAPMRAWLSGNMNELGRLALDGLLGDEELRQTLLVQRNQDWVGAIVSVLEGDEDVLVAVGGAHMLGAEGLPELLRARGYEVKRVE